jgi:hypothetical protein
MSLCSGFAVVFAEDVPDVSVQDITTGEIFPFFLLVVTQMSAC